MRIHELFENVSSSLKAWFAGSQVVNPDGSPKRMYHGTGGGDIQAFDVNKIDPNGLYGPGFYFTDSPDVAGSTGGAGEWSDIDNNAVDNRAGYAFQRAAFTIDDWSDAQWKTIREQIIRESRNAREHDQQVGWSNAFDQMQRGRDKFREWVVTDAPPWLVDSLGIERHRHTMPTIYPVYLSIKNPLDMDILLTDEIARLLIDVTGFDEYDFREYPKRIAEKEITVGDFYREIARWFFYMRKKEESVQPGKIRMNRALIRAGYDGIHHQGGGVVGTFGDHEVWIAFSPNQIKSVFSAKFDPASDDLSEGR